MADAFDDGNHYSCHLVVKSLVLLIIIESVLGSGYPHCQVYPSRPEDMRASTSGQYLMSPMYPSRYPNDLNCHWRIIAPNSSQIIVLEVEEISIEYHEDCDYDFLRIYDGMSTLSHILGTYCGNHKFTVKSSGSGIFLRLFTDSSVNYKGFKIKYYSTSKDSLSKQDEDPKGKDTMVIVGGIVGGVLCSLLLLAFVCVFATTKKCQCCRKPSNRRTVHPNTSDDLPIHRRRVQPRIDNIQRSSTPPVVENIPMQELPVYTVSASLPPPYIDSYYRPPDEPYPSRDSLYRLPSSPPPPYSIVDPYGNPYAVPNSVPIHYPLRRT